MSRRLTRQRRLLRDLPLAYRLIIFSVLVAAAFGYWISGSTTSRTPKEVHEENIEQKYVGKIIIPTDREDTCQLFALDNRTGQLQDKGYGPCAKMNYDLKADPDQRRSVEIGKAFRRDNK